jgi:hypothetical protein
MMYYEDIPKEVTGRAGLDDQNKFEVQLKR